MCIGYIPDGLQIPETWAWYQALQYELCISFPIDPPYPQVLHLWIQPAENT